MPGSIIVPGTTRTQAGATLITEDMTIINSSTAPAAGVLLGDGILMPSVGSGTDKIVVINNTANPIQAYGNGTDTINGIASTQGIAVSPYSLALFAEVAPGGWQCGLDAAPMAAFNSLASATSLSLTAASVAGGTASVDLAISGVQAGGITATLPTVAALLPSLYSPSLGTNYRLRIINTNTTQTATVTTATGWTLTGTMTIATATWREFIVILTNVGGTPTATLQSVAVGTYS